MAAFDVELQKLIDSPTSSHRPVPLAEAVAAFHRRLRKRGLKWALANELTHLYLLSLLGKAEELADGSEDECSSS